MGLAHCPALSGLVALHLQYQGCVAALLALRFVVLSLWDSGRLAVEKMWVKVRTWRRFRICRFASLRSPFGQPAAGYLRYAPVAGGTGLGSCRTRLGESVGAGKAFIWPSADRGKVLHRRQAGTTESGARSPQSKALRASSNKCG